MDEDERSVDVLIELAEEIPETMELTAGMDAIRGTARGEGISLAVDLQGMLVELELDDQALALGPQRLAAEISRLTTEAGTSALREGMHAIKAGCGDKVAATIVEPVLLPGRHVVMEDSANLIVATVPRLTSSI